MNVKPEVKVFDVYQDNSGTYTAVLLDGDGARVSSASITTATLTLFDPTTEEIINSRQTQNILNANNVTIDTSGNLTWDWTPDDMPKLNDSKNPEVHIAIFTFTWDSGEQQIKHEVRFRVHKVTDYEG